MSNVEMDPNIDKGKAIVAVIKIGQDERKIGRSEVYGYIIAAIGAFKREMKLVGSNHAEDNGLDTMPTEPGVYLLDGQVEYEGSGNYYGGDDDTESFFRGTYTKLSLPELDDILAQDKKEEEDSNGTDESEHPQSPG